MAGVVTLVNSILRGQSTVKAQGTDPAARTPESTSQNDTTSRVVVTDSDPYDYDSVSLRGFTDPPLTTPQTATVVTPKLRQDEAVTSLRDALRNVSGISLGAGEGSYQGDNYSIRGLAGRSDTFIDGMRDFGSYYRDPFDTENIEVLKGASSTEFGRGSAGGAVNLVTKQPELQGFTAGSALHGTNDTKRGTLDFDEPIAGLKGAAFRLNLMGEDTGETDRDFIRYNRWGVAPSLAFGLGTSTRLYVDYLHQFESDRPDWVKLPAGHLVLYPATSLHQVRPVTRGARVCSFFWIQSMVRDDARRSLLFDLDLGIQRLNRELPGHPSAVQFTGVYHNLLRQWAEV